MNVIMTIFVVVAAIALVLQLGTLFALFLALRKTTERLEAMAGRLENQTAPILSTAHAILDEAQPKLSEITSNLAESTAMVRAQVAEVAGATTEILGRARLQAERIDEFVGNTISRLELTTEFVQQSVITPIKRIHAIVQALGAGFEVLRGIHSRRKTSRNSTGADADEEMFI